MLDYVGSDCVRLLRLGVPSHKFYGERAELECLFDLEREQLYSVKWYKDDNEFYRFIPGDQDQKVTTFKLPGISVKVSVIIIDVARVSQSENEMLVLLQRRDSNRNRVVLNSVNLYSAGQYRCEISAEAPLFNTVSRSSEMVVVGKKKNNPFMHKVG